MFLKRILPGKVAEVAFQISRKLSAHFLLKNIQLALVMPESHEVGVVWQPAGPPPGRLGLMERKGVGGENNFPDKVFFLFTPVSDRLAVTERVIKTVQLRCAAQHMFAVMTIVLIFVQVGEVLSGLCAKFIFYKLIGSRIANERRQIFIE